MDPLTLAVVGAAYGTTLAVGVSRRAWLRGSTAEGLLALLLACGVVATVTIVLQHRFAGALAGALLERLEVLSILSSGPALLLYMGSTTAGRPVRPAHLLHFAPALATGLSPVALVAPIEILLAHQVSYTLVAAVGRLRHRPPVRQHAATTWAVLGVLGLVHLAQGARLATRGSGRLIDVVPTTLSVALLGLGALAAVAWLTHSGSLRSSRRPRRNGPRARAGSPAPEEEELVRRLDRLMAERHLYRRSDLGLHDLAAELEVTPHRLSEALNDGAGTTLTHYLARLRVEDAKRRLLDPAHGIYTIEAIGGMSGFGSRSGFYAVFRREVGTTPTRFRAVGGAPSEAPFRR